jgi:hypothetical protein
VLDCFDLTLLRKAGDIFEALNIGKIHSGSLRKQWA